MLADQIDRQQQIINNLKSEMEQFAGGGASVSLLLLLLLLFIVFCWQLVSVF
jgi:hypothetical protein